MIKVIILFLISILCLSGCEENHKKVDNTEYAFTDICWVRDGGHDIETIKFRSDGSFSYSCGCGNPVNDADLCEGYIYDEETMEIHLNCFETTEDMVTTIKILEISDEILELDFNGDIRKFYKDE